MAMTGLLALIDDIATVLDDVAVLSKVAVKKTAGVLGDDLALNAAQVTGVRAEREIPVVWAVAKGSFVNKLILVPLALAISAFIPVLITPLLMLGGGYLCFEGFEKLAHKFFHSKAEKQQHHKTLVDNLSNSKVDLVQFEKQKIKGAIRTDFILSAEIVVIALGTVSEAEFMTQVMVVSGIAMMMTIGVYGLVAGIVKIDDLGLYLQKKQQEGFTRTLGEWLILLAPKLMKVLSILGTAAMFLVGGGIIVHGLPFLHHLLHDMNVLLTNAGGVVQLLAELIATGALGILSGGLILLVVNLIKPLFKAKQAAAE
ncbi:Inner membrane protein YedI [Thalassocella blandensis]|nr:Inner membrane protein YedI [Thalassocella blandensis]